uniref:PET domain-containing protein n=1 Tax=Strigamia maritima TaxID=126957 RepID=T1JP59_STRMM
MLRRDLQQGHQQHVAARANTNTKTFMCKQKQWWKVCWVYGDQYKVYRQTYARKQTIACQTTFTMEKITHNVDLDVDTKICRNCKCSREDHGIMTGIQSSIDTERILTKMANPVGNSEVGQRHSQSDDDSGCALEEYTWVPPGLKSEQ